MVDKSGLLADERKGGTITSLHRGTTHVTVQLPVGTAVEYNGAAG